MLKGITRMKVLEFGYANSNVEERDVLLTEIPTAKEAFITSTSRHIVPVSSIDDILICGAATGPTPGAAPGPVAQQLNYQLYRLVAGGAH